MRAQSLHDLSVCPVHVMGTLVFGQNDYPKKPLTAISKEMWECVCMWAQRQVTETKS